MVTQLTVGNVSAKYARLMFAEKTFCPPLTQFYLREQKFTPSAVYELPFKIAIENKLRSFQFISILSTVNKCSLSIRRFWGKGERWKRKRENLLSPSPLGRPDTQARINA